MDQLLEVPNIKNESTELTSSDQVELSSKMQVKSVKQESDCLVQADIDIKMEPLEDENQLSAIVGISYDLCLNYNMKIEMEEPLIKIECEDVLDELIEDPLDVGSKIKAQVPLSNLNGETSNKPEQIGEEIDKVDYNLTSGDKESNTSGTSKNQNQFLVQRKKFRKNNKYICHICNKTFGQKSDLDRHLLIHSGTRPFKCEICEQSFTRKGHLDTHMLIHSGEKPHICDVCSKVFRQKSTLNDHKLIHSNKKLFLCDECNKSFTQKHDLVKHKRIHTGAKPFACDLCVKSFTQHSHLNTHRRLHTGEKPYSCDVCNKSFADRSSFNRHKKIHKN